MLYWQPHNISVLHTSLKVEVQHYQNYHPCSMMHYPHGMWITIYPSQNSISLIIHKSTRGDQETNIHFSVRL